MKKVTAIIFSIFCLMTILTACGINSSSSSSSSHKVAGYKMYSVNVKSIKEDKDDHEFTVTGTTDAPDGSKIYVSSTDTSYASYGDNAASGKDDITNWAKVKDGKFEANVDPNNLYFGRFKEGQKVSAYIFAIKGFDKEARSTYQFSKSKMKQIKGFASVSTFKITDDIAKYLNDIYDNATSKDSSDDDYNDTSDDTSDDDIYSYQDVSYDSIARKPDDYDDKKVRFAGKVLQVTEETEDDQDYTELRIAVNGDYDNVIFAVLPSDILNGSRVLEGDLVAIYGNSLGIITYTSSMNTDISVPGIAVHKIDDAGKASDDYGY